VLSDCRGMQSMFVHQPLVDIDVGLVTKRVRHLHDRAIASGRSVYIGTTSDPSWRWNGGWGWRGNDRSFMRGHKLSYDEMQVVASFPDKQCGEVEKHVIAHFPRADNKVASQKGLA
ncbi:unnamed protein product, partial [Prorocentrum cordatum]